MTPEQRSAYIAQQMSQFQAVQEQVTSKCSQTEASPPSSQPMMPPRAGLLQNSLSPGMIPPTRPQSHEGLGVISSTPGKQQGIVNSNPLLLVPSHSGLNPLSSLGSVCRRLKIPKATPSGVPLPPSPHQLRQPCVPRMPAMFNSAAWAAAAARTTVVSREPALSRVDNSIQHLDSNSIFTKAPTTVPMVAPTFPPHQALAPPNQVTSGGRSGHKVSVALVDPSFSLLGTQNLRQSPVRGPVPALNATKSLQQGMASFGPMSPIHGIEPPSYVVAATATAAASAVAASQSPGPFTRMGSPPALAPYDFLPLPQPPPSLNGLISPHDCSEADFIEALLQGPGASPEEGWVCNLRLIDDILQEHATTHVLPPRALGGFKCP